MELKLVDTPVNPKHYHGKPCKKCGSTLKLKSNRTCIACTATASKKWRVENLDRDRQRRRDYQRDHKETRRRVTKNIRLKYRYGITIAEFDRMYAGQGGKCAICITAMPKPYVDHCHQSGAVRGLLCFHCNTALGHFRDNTEYLEAAIAYLNHPQKATNAA